MLSRRSFFILLGVFVIQSADPAGLRADCIYYGPTQYFSFDDSPFKDVNFQFFALEDFEDGALNTPNVSASAGVVRSPSEVTDSVDLDGGVLDGLGRAGHSYYSDGARTIQFTFDGGDTGLPTYVGITIADVGETDEDFGFGVARVAAYDKFGGVQCAFGTGRFGDGRIDGMTEEDQFLGISTDQQIRTLVVEFRLSGDWEIDHLQYGLVPEADSIMLLLLMAAFAARFPRYIS